MNTLLEPPLQRTKSSPRQPLSPPPPKELEIDRAIRLAGITPIDKKVVNRHMRETIRALKQARGIPLWWSGAVQEGIQTGLIAAYAIACFAFVAVGLGNGLLAVIEFGTLKTAVPFLVPTTIAVLACFFISLICLSFTPIGEWRTPYWDSLPLADYQRNMHSTLHPAHVKEMIEELRLRLPKARFRVHFLNYANDPILSVSDGLRRRYLVIWE